MARQPWKAKKRLPIAKLVRAMAKDTFMSEVETIRAAQTNPQPGYPSVAIVHNSTIELMSNLLYTTQGNQSSESPTNSGTRTGDQILLKGVSMKFMVELKKQYSDVTFRLLVLKCARGDIPQSSGYLFNNLSSNRMLDTINTDRYTIMQEKWFKLKASNTATFGSQFANSGDTGTYKLIDNSSTVISPSTKIVSTWIPGYKFAPGGRIQYNHGSFDPKFFDYRALLYAYSNQACGATQEVAMLNDCVKVMYYKDA